MAKTPALKVTNLQKVYKSGTHALNGLNLEIEKGEFFALLGPNGSGKSTFINIMSGPTKKTSGEIKINGLEIDDHRQETKYMIGVVPQEINFDSFFTVNEVLVQQSGYYGIKNNQAFIDDILEKLNLFGKKNSNTRALSGGMKRRLMIARALVHNPDIIVLDEPTAGVDVELRHGLWEYVVKLNKEEGKTILLTTHYLEEAETLCDRTAIIHKGQLVAVDKTKKLIKSMGTQRALTLTLNKSLKEAPKQLAAFAPEINGKDLTLTFESNQIADLFKAIGALKDHQINDLELTGQNLEDVFINLTYKQNG